MKKTTITVSYDEEKYKALKMYLERKDMTIDEELTKALDALYNKTVPADVRRFLEMMSGGVSAPATTPRPKKPKPSVSSAVGASPAPEVKQDERH